MGFQGDFGALCRALESELREFSPYTMVTIIGFGRVGEHAPLYASLRGDVFDTIALFRLLRPDVDFSDIDALPVPAKGRLIDEKRLGVELSALRDALLWIADEAEHADAAAFDAAWRKMEPARRREFEASLERAGLTEAAPNPRRGEKIFVSSRFSTTLARQIVPAIRQAGMAPVAPPRSAAPRASGEDRGTLRKHLEGCRGGVLCFLDPPSEEARLSFAPELHRSAMLQEIEEAHQRFPDRMVVITRQDAPGPAPAALRGKALFEVSGDHMTAGERERFGALILRETWR